LKQNFNNNVSKIRADVKIPSIGLGTYKFKKGSGDAQQAILDASRLGYRHFDTAFIYGGEQTEKEVGKAIVELTTTGMIPRSELFLTTKQWRAYHGYDATLKCLDLSLKRLNVDYVDLYLIHWPGPAYNTMNRRKDVMENALNGPFVYAKDGHETNNIQKIRGETWRAMEDAVYQGKCKAIGVSNFTIRHLEALKKTARIWPPAVNQIELHPYNPQNELVQYCREEDIIVEAYASLGGQDSGKRKWSNLGGKLLERNEVHTIASKHNKTEAQVLLKWATQQGHVVIPKSTKQNHMKENLEAVSDMLWKLDDDDLKSLACLDQSQVVEGDDVEKTRLCWVRDPLKMLDFD